MEKFRSLQKGLVTTVFAILIFVVIGHKYFTTGEFDFGMVLGALGGAGLLFAKDQSASHTK